MPVCLYCRAPTSGEEGRAHVLPEAVVANNVIMPRGAMCDACNNYFGCLDTALATHPMMAFGIQAFGLPGKRGKPRMELGWFHRAGGHSSRAISIPARGVKHVGNRDGQPFVGLTPPVDENRRRFHRSLYYVAFNLLSLYHDIDSLLSEVFDPVRRYVRSPSPGETWPYCHAMLTPQLIDSLDLLILDAPTPQVAMLFFNHALAVDLLQTPTLREQLMSWAPPDLDWSQVS